MTTATNGDDLRALIRSGHREIIVPDGVTLKTNVGPNDGWTDSGPLRIVGDGIIAWGTDGANWPIHAHVPLLRWTSGKIEVEGVTLLPPIIDTAWHIRPEINPGATMWPFAWISPGVEITFRNVKSPDISRGNWLVFQQSPGAGVWPKSFVTFEDCDISNRFSISALYGAGVTTFKRNRFRNSFVDPQGVAHGITSYQSSEGELIAEDNIIVDSARCGFRVEGKNSRGLGKGTILRNKFVKPLNLCIEVDYMGEWAIHGNDFGAGPATAITAKGRAGYLNLLRAEDNVFACKKVFAVVREGLANEGPCFVRATFADNFLAGCTQIYTGGVPGGVSFHRNWNGWMGNKSIDGRAYAAVVGEYVWVDGGSYVCDRLHSFVEPMKGVIRVQGSVIRGGFGAAVWNTGPVAEGFKWSPRLFEATTGREWYKPLYEEPVA